MNFEKIAFRQSDQKVFVANIEKAKTYFNWYPKIDYLNGIDKMISWVENTN